MATYSFKDTGCSIVGPGIAVSIGAGSGVAEEGIKLSPAEDKNTMTIGADGSGQHSLVASDAAHIELVLLKTSPLNKILMLAYDIQSASSALWGNNTITLTDAARGDFSVMQSCAFKKKPEIKNAKEAGTNTWEFDVIKASSLLGGG